MKKYEAAKELFKDAIDPSFYFDSISAEIARKNLQEAIGDETLPLIFIVGDPGVGKSHMMRLMHHATAVRSLTVFIDHPFFDPNDLFKLLYDARGIVFIKTKTQGEILEELFEAYVGMKCTIFIDEAQLLNDAQFELIRILGDLKLFQFVLAMHKDEGRLLLQKKQFKTRTKLVIEYGNIEENEVLRYVQSLLMGQAFGDIALMFSRSEAKAIARYTRGNFRTIKKFLYTLMKLLAYAQRNNLSKYRKINSCLLAMTALDIGLIHDA
jgi:type II secretory pathway predicted ATPase ExeA